MEIYFINICIEWLFKLYKEYLENIKIFIKDKLNKEVHIILLDEKSNYISEFKKIYDLNKKNKFIFCGNIGCVNEIYELIHSPNIYYLNIEQMSHYSYYKMFRNLNINIKVIDYSEENISYIKKNYKKYFLLPPFFFNYKNLNKNIDIISLSNNSYRLNILNNIDKKFKIKFLDNVFGEERDNIFKRTKIYINIHCSKEHKTMELIRIINLLKKKVIVISENSIYKDLLFIKDSIITFENIEQLNYLLNEITNNYDLYFKKLFFNNNFTYYNNYVLSNLLTIINDT